MLTSKNSAPRSKEVQASVSVPASTAIPVSRARRCLARNTNWAFSVKSMQPCSRYTRYHCALTMLVAEPILAAITLSCSSGTPQMST